MKKPTDVLSDYAAQLPWQWLGELKCAPLLFFRILPKGDLPGQIGGSSVERLAEPLDGFFRLIREPWREHGS
jgi:hypothetical protein